MRKTLRDRPGRDPEPLVSIPAVVVFLYSFLWSLLFIYLLASVHVSWLREFLLGSGRGEMSAYTGFAVLSVLLCLLVAVDLWRQSTGKAPGRRRRLICDGLAMTLVVCAQWGMNWLRDIALH